MILENQAATADVVRSTKADIGLAWDGDYDRCFFFDEHGQFIEGLLPSSACLRKYS